MPASTDPLARPVAWRRTGLCGFNLAASVDGQWWVLRFNGFPDHPVCTLFVDGEVVGDVHESQDWGEDGTLTSAERDQVRALMRDLSRYGSEVGQPCDGDWCCAHRTVEFIDRS